MHHEHGNVDDLEIVVELALGENLDAVILGLDTAHHSLPPPVFLDSLGDNRARAVEAVERNGDVFVELGTMIRSAVAETVDDLLRDAIRVPVRLHECRGDGADEDSLCYPAFAVLSNIASHLAAAGGVSDVDGVLQIEGLDKFGNIGSIGIHVVAGCRLRGTSVASTIVGNYAVTAFKEEHHLGIPVVGGEWPSMVKEKRLACAPVLVENLRAVFDGYALHAMFSFFDASGFARSEKCAGVCPLHCDSTSRREKGPRCPES